MVGFRMKSKLKGIIWMDELTLFTMILGLSKLWQVVDIRFSKEESRLDLKTTRAYHIKLALARFWELKQPGRIVLYLKRWYFWATHSRLRPIIEVTKAIKRNWNGVVSFTTSRITNGVVEGLNSKIKTAMKKAYGFKHVVYPRTIVYLVARKLCFD